MVAGHPDTAMAVALLEKARHLRPSGITFLQLSMAEAFHGQDAGSWEIVQKAIDHCRMAEDSLGVVHAPVLPVRMNALNFALRLCPPGERPALLEQAAGTARYLGSTPYPIARMQRAFYFGIIGDERAEVGEWRETVRLGGGAGIFASYYAAAMFAAGRSAEALDVLSTPTPSPDSLATIYRAYLLLDVGSPDEARRHGQQVLAGERSLAILAETVLLLTGEAEQVAINAGRLLEAPPLGGDFDLPALEYWAGRRSVEDTIASAGPSGVLLSRAHFFVGLASLARGDRGIARHHFDLSDATGTHWRTEHQWSRALLARLKRDPQWPPWIPH